MSDRRFTAFAWGTLAYTIAVIFWGGFVRATGSGAGCGAHWPLCNGAVVPRSAGVETLIEFTHRLTSGLALIAVAVLLVWAYRVYPRSHRVRRGAVASMAFMVLEALIGAGLVLLELVAYTVSVARGYWMAAHLVNTFFLLAALALTAWWAAGRPGFRLRGQGGLGLLFATTLAGMLVLGASGAVAALGDTLTLGGGVSPDASPTVAALVGMRIYHPLLACVVVILIAVSIWQTWSRREGPALTSLGYALGVLFTAQLMIGLVNVWLQAPVSLQLIHLVFADLLWITLVLFTAAALAAEPRPVLPTADPARPVAAES